MANVEIAINYATVADVQTGDNTNTPVNPVALKSALQSGTNLFPLNIASATINNTIDATKINCKNLITATNTISGLNIAVGKTATIGAAGTLTLNSNISAGGNIVFGNTGSNIVGTNSVGNRTISTSTPVGGSNGDIWYQV
jgi:hypothetical protein